jgi:hypothetical protein
MTRSILGPTRRGPPAPQQEDLVSLTQGVSQMPHHLRPPGTPDEQINAWSSTVEGVRKRQPAELMGQLFRGEVAEMFSASLSYGPTEHYALIIVRGEADPTETFLGIYDVDTWRRAKVTAQGLGLTVQGGGDTPDGGGDWVRGGSDSYLYAEPVLGGYSLINNGSLGLLLNRRKTVVMAPARSPVRTNESMLFIQGVSFDITYTVKVDDIVVGSYTTPKASDTDNQLSQSKVASELATALDAIAGINAVVGDYVVRVRRDDGGVVSLGLDDGRGNTLGRAINATVTTTAELPVIAPVGYVVRSRNEPGTTIDDRWFKFVPFNEGKPVGQIVKGTWQETIKPDTPYRFSRNTMPMVIYRAGPNNFFVGSANGTELTANGSTYKFPEWGNRTAGDETLVKDPPFVGRAIKDHTIFRGRYMVCAGNRVVCSEVDDIFNFFVDSTVQVQDTDTFDLLANSIVTADLRWLLVVDESVLAFGPESQFVIATAGDSDVLSPRSAVITPISDILINPRIRPRLSGASVLFASNEFGFTNVREMQAFNSSQRRLGLNLGASLNVNRTTPKYVKGQATHWDLGQNQDFAVYMTDADPRTLYVYKYLWTISGNSIQKAQAAWSKWTFSVDIRHLFFDQNYLYLFASSPDGLEVLRLATEELQLESNPLILLDRRILHPATPVPSTYDPISDVTTFQLPYTPTAPAHAISMYEPTTGAQNILLGTTEPGSSQIRCTATLGDHRGEQIAFGEEYQMKFIFSKVFPQVQRRDGSGGMIGNTRGRLQLLTWEVDHRDTGFYQIRIQRPQRPDTVTPFRSRVLGVSGNRLTTERDFASDGYLRVPVYCQNIDATISVESSSWLPVVLTGAKWEGVHSDRSP